MIKAAAEITMEEYKDGIFILEDDEQMVTGYWLIPDDWYIGNRMTAYARWYASREGAEEQALDD